MIDIGSTSETLPYIATAIGAGVGAGFEIVAQRNIRKNQESLAAVWGDVVAQSEAPTPNRLKKVARYIGTPLVAACALAGFANGVVWESESAIRQIPPSLEIVVDHSGATALGDNPAAPEIAHIVSQFNDEGSINATTLIAGLGEVIKAKPADVAKKAPFGDAPLDQATNRALEDAMSGSGGVKSLDKKSSGVLVITNGNTIGVPETVIAEATSDNVPVFVVNVEADKSDTQTTQGLQAIAKGTHAEYWDANKHNIDQVSEDIQKVLVPQDVHDKQSNDKWPQRLFAAALSVGTIGVIFKKRREMTTGNRII